MGRWLEHSVTTEIQAPVQREHYRLLFRDLVYAAIAD